MISKPKLHDHVVAARACEGCRSSDLPLAACRGAALFLACTALSMVTSLGQVVLDGKFGTSGALAGPNYDIGAAAGATRGNNLFHSFSQFDVSAGESATFSGPPTIQNILGRVTGGQPSSIFGTVRSAIAGANLFLINPNGVVIGPNASIDVSGSFAVSSANYLTLADGARFVASLDADDSRLSTSPVASFGFLEGASGTVEVRGSLKAGQGSTLSVVGSSVSVLDGAQLEAIDGGIQIRGVSAPGDVPFSLAASAAGRVPGPGVSPRGAEAPAGGKVVIRGGRLVVENAQINVSETGGNIEIGLSDGLEVINGGQILTTSAGAVKGGDILVESPKVLIDGQDGPAPTRIAAETWSDSPEGAGGNVLIRAQSVELIRGAEISVSTFGSADAGQVEITASTLRLEGSDFPQFPTQLSANAAPFIGTEPGAGGGIVVHADSVEINNGAGILAATTGDADAGTVAITSKTLSLRNGGITTSTAAAGKGGEIQIKSGRLTLDGPFASITAATSGVDAQLPAGSGGVIAIEADRLELLNDSGISATTFGDARGGDVRIQAGSILLAGATFQPGSIPGITAASKPPFFGEGGGGAGGDISISAGSLTLRGGMTISTTTSTTGDGGSVIVQTGSLALEDGASIQSAAVSAGQAGTLAIDSAQDVLLKGESTISTSAPESSGGDIQVKAGNAIRLFDSQITAQAGPGGGGNITILAPSLIYLLNSALDAQAIGDGGNLTIDPVFFILNNGSLISRSSSQNGGNITILSDYFLQSTSLIDASAPFGLPGTVSVSAPEVDLSGSLIGLPGNLLGLDTQLRPDCGVRLSGNISSFIVLGRGGLPLEPGGFVPSAALLPLDDKP